MIRVKLTWLHSLWVIESYRDERYNLERTTCTRSQNLTLPQPYNRDLPYAIVVVDIDIEPRIRVIDVILTSDNHPMIITNYESNVSFPALRLSPWLIKQRRVWKGDRWMDLKIG